MCWLILMFFKAKLGCSLPGADDPTETQNAENKEDEEEDTNEDDENEEQSPHPPHPARPKVQLLLMNKRIPRS